MRFAIVAGAIAATQRVHARLRLTDPPRGPRSRRQGLFPACASSRSAPSPITCLGSWNPRASRSRITLAQDATLHAFFAQGMLMNVAAAMDLPELAAEDAGWLTACRAATSEEGRER
jgi:hypothetical protein